jgi:hypothetical protein
MWRPFASDYFWTWVVYLPVLYGAHVNTQLSNPWDFKVGLRQPARRVLCLPAAGSRKKSRSVDALPAAEFGMAASSSWCAQGCGGNSDWDLTTIEFRNDGWADQWFCMDRLHLV